jgi:hypothetical protein
MLFGTAVPTAALKPDGVLSFFARVPTSFQIDFCWSPERLSVSLARVVFDILDMWLAAEAAVAPDIANVAASTSEAHLFITGSPRKGNRRPCRRNSASAPMFH